MFWLANKKNDFQLCPHIGRHDSGPNFEKMEGNITFELSISTTFSPPIKFHGATAVLSNRSKNMYRM